jgi:hypothetical protein
VAHAPPFWHARSCCDLDSSLSSASDHSLHPTRPPAIALEDHSPPAIALEDHSPPAIALEDHSDARDLHARSCWARAVSVDDYVVVSGPTGIGAYVVWHCTVSTLPAGHISIRKRSLAMTRVHIA